MNKIDIKVEGDPKPSEHRDMEPFSTALAKVKITVNPVKVDKEPIKDSDSEEEGEGEKEKEKDPDVANPVFPPEQQDANAPANNQQMQTD